MEEPLYIGDLDLTVVTAHHELIALLRTVHLRADKPSLRALERETRHQATPLSKTVVADMLSGKRFPRKAVMVAFLRACRVQEDQLESWRRVWDRVVDPAGQGPIVPEPTAKLVTKTAVEAEKQRVVISDAERDAQVADSSGLLRLAIIADSPDKASIMIEEPYHLALARRLRSLRLQHWLEMRLTQATLAEALGGEGRLSPAVVSSWESNSSPKLPSRNHLEAYARFFATHRSVEGASAQLLSLRDLADDEREAYEELKAELFTLRDVAKKSSLGGRESFNGSWHFSDPGPITLICAQLPDAEIGHFADPANPDYTELQSYAALDAMVELYGFIRAENPAMDVSFKLPSQVTPDDFSSHVVLLGGTVWNEIIQNILMLSDLPVRQIADSAINVGKVFVADHDGKENRFLPKWDPGDGNNLVEDVGLIFRTVNPLNSNRTLTICNGTHSRGVLGAVRTLTDKRLRESNERYLGENFADSINFAIIMRVPILWGGVITPKFNAPGCVLYQWPQ